MGGFGEVGAGPAYKGITFACRVVEGEGLCLDIVGVRIGGGHGASCKVVGDVIEDGGPCGGVAAVANGTLRNSDVHGRLIEVGACPASEGVAFAGGVVEGEGGRLNIVSGGVGGAHAAASEVVGDVVGDDLHRDI